MTHSIAWDKVTNADVLRAISEYDRLGPDRFFSARGFAPTTTYDLVWDERLYPPKAILGTAYEFATGERLASADFEGGKVWGRQGARTAWIHHPAAGHVAPGRSLAGWPDDVQPAGVHGQRAAYSSWRRSQCSSSPSSWRPRGVRSSSP